AIQRCKDRIALPGEAAEHGIDERLVVAGCAVLRCCFHIHGNGCVRGDAEKQDLGGTCAENVLRASGALRQFLVEKGGDHFINCAKAADGGGGNGAGESAVAGRGLCERAGGCFFGKGFVERAAALQHGG